MNMNGPNNVVFANHLFNLLSAAAMGKLLSFARNQRLFSQGEAAECLYVVKGGRVKVSALLSNGKQLIIRICQSGELIGEESILGSTRRTSTATVMEPCSFLAVHRNVMVDALHRNPELMDYFIQHMIQRNIEFQRNIAVDRCRSAEYRLARALLVLAGPRCANPEGLVPRTTHEELSEMVGTTRSRITQFMTKMNATGYICNQGEIRVNRERLGVFLHKQD